MRNKKELSIPESPRRPASDEFDRNAKELVDCLQKGLAAQGVQDFVETQAATETQVARVGCQAPEPEPEWVRLQMDGRKTKVELKGGLKVQKLADHVTRKFAYGVAGQSVRLMDATGRELVDEDILTKACTLRVVAVDGVTGDASAHAQPTLDAKPALGGDKKRQTLLHAPVGRVRQRQRQEVLGALGNLQGAVIFKPVGPP